MSVRTRETVKKTLIVMAGLFMLIALVVLTSAPVQSRFVEKNLDGTPVFIDKYVPKTLRHEFAGDLGKATKGFLVESGLLAARPARGPIAYFAADRHYGVISANDSLVKKRLQGRPSSDFVLFRSIGTNFYANELVTRSVAAQDGSYVFVNIDQHWRASILHAYTHAIAAANAPASIAASFRLDQGYDPELRFAFRFVDETFALFASDLLELSATTGSLDAAWASFAAATRNRYAEQCSDVQERQAEIIMATFDLPQKSAEFYSACNSFAAWLLEQYGRESFGAAAASFFSGAYTTLDDLFVQQGGLEAAVKAWKGESSIPR
jgi:hypothetical protein